MNLQKITEYYPWTDAGGDRLQGTFSLCLDRNSSSGEFSFLYLLLKHLRQGVNVKLLSCNHSIKHYTAILRKNNLDAGKLLQEGKLEIFCLAVSMENTLSEQQSSWSQLLQWQDQLPTTKSTGSVVFMVDDVDMLELVAPSAQTARRFMVRSLDYLRSSSVLKQKSEEGTLALHSVVAFGRHPQETMAQLSSLGATALVLSNTGGQSGGMTGSSTAGQGSRAPVSEEDDGQPALAEFLRYRADITITVSALETGYSSAVHGMVTVTQRSQGVQRQLLHYKALDSGVLCAKVGHSTF